MTYAQKFVGGMIGILAVTVLVDSAQMWVAAKTDDGLVTQNYYAEGLHYDAERPHTQNTEGWQVRFETPREAMRPGPVRVVLRDRHQHPVTGAEVSLDLFRPNKAGYDQNLKLTESRPGQYEAIATLPLQGIWDATVHFKKGATLYDYQQRLMLLAER